MGHGVSAHLQQAYATALLEGLTALRYSRVYQSATRHVPVVTAAYAIGDPIKGYAADSFVEIKPLGGGVVPQVGIDGEVTRLVSTDETHEITLTLMQTSESHIYLLERWRKDREDGSGIFTIGVRDGSVQAEHYSHKAWIKNLPEYQYGREAGEFKWTIVTADLNTSIDGAVTGGLLGYALDKLGGALFGGLP